MKSTIRILAGVLACIVAAGCGGGGWPGPGGGGAGAATMTNVGPAGGQASSADGVLTVTFPQGALAQSTTIVITTLGAADLRPDAAALQPIAAYSVEPAGLVLGAPATALFDLVAAEGSAKIEVASAGVALDSGKGALEVPDTEVRLDASKGRRTAEAVITALSRAYVYSDGALRYTVDAPTSVPSGATAIVQVGVVRSSAENFEWSSTTTGGLTDDLSDTLVPFDGGTSFVGIFNLTCPAGVAGGTCTVSVAGEVEVPVEGSAKKTPITATQKRTTRTTFTVVCVGGGGSGLEQPTIVDLSTLRLDDVEGASPVPSASSCAGVSNDPRFVFGCRNTMTGFGATAVVIDPVLAVSNPTAAVVTQFNLGAAPGTAFDAHILVGGGREAVQTTGSEEGFISEVLSGCTGTGGGLFTFGFHEDCNMVGTRKDMTISCSGPHVRIRGVGSGGVVQGPSYLFPSTVRSAVMNNAMDRIVSIGTDGLRFTEVDGAGGINSTTIVDSSFGAANPRRIDWDLVTRILVFSLFDTDLVMVGKWDGETAPVVTDTANVADGPVGGSIESLAAVPVKEGPTAASARAYFAGFNDDQYSIIEIDAAGNVLGVVTQPIPVSPVHGGMLNPGHAIWSDGIIAFGNFGDASAAFVPAP